MESIREKSITNFVYKNYPKTRKETSKGSLEVIDAKQIKLSNAQKNIVKHFLKKSIGPNKDGLILLLKDGEECLTINQKGDIFGPS